MKTRLTSPWSMLLTSLALVVAIPGAHAEDVPSFSSLDRDGDGKVSAEEASVRHGLPELIEYYDQNGDGRLDEREYQALVEEAARETEGIINTSDSKD